MFFERNLDGRLIGANKASTFTGFCEFHDQEIFRDLDTKEFDGSSRLTFLSAYRALCRELYAKKTHVRGLSLSKGLDKGRPPKEQLIFQDYMSTAALSAEIGLRELEGIKSKFDISLLAQDFSTYRFSNFYFAATPNLVSAGGFNPTHDLKGNEIQRLYNLSTPSKHLLFAILPTKNGFWASFLWEKDSAPIIEQLIDSLGKDNPTVGSIYCLAVSSLENTYFRPSFWKGLTDETRQTFRWLTLLGPDPDQYIHLAEAKQTLSALYPQQPMQMANG